MIQSNLSFLVLNNLPQTKEKAPVSLSDSEWSLYGLSFGVQYVQWECSSSYADENICRAYEEIPCLSWIRTPENLELKVCASALVPVHYARAG